MNPIERTLIKESDRVNHTAALFGFHFPLHLEPLVYAMTERLSADYRGGYWHFYQLGNGAFYMAPDEDTVFHVVCENGFDGQLSADAFGITACLYAYSHLASSECWSRMYLPSSTTGSESTRWSTPRRGR